MSPRSRTRRWCKQHKIQTGSDREFELYNTLRSIWWYVLTEIVDALEGVPVHSYILLGTRLQVSQPSTSLGVLLWLHCLGVLLWLHRVGSFCTDQSYSHLSTFVMGLRYETCFILIRARSVPRRQSRSSRFDNCSIHLTRRISRAFARLVLKIQKFACRCILT